jgi:hypothetical protein
LNSLNDDWEENMSTRRKLARERFEYYLVYLILAYRRLILIVGLLMLAYAVTVMSAFPFTGFATLLPAIYLLLLGNSYNFVVYTARLGAWIGTLWRHDA